MFKAGMCSPQSLKQQLWVQEEDKENGLQVPVQPHLPSQNRTSQNRTSHCLLWETMKAKRDQWGFRAVLWTVKSFSSALCSHRSTAIPSLHQCLSALGHKVLPITTHPFVGGSSWQWLSPGDLVFTKNNPNCSLCSLKRWKNVALGQPKGTFWFWELFLLPGELKAKCFF